MLEADVEIDHGAVVIAAITSCTNTSNPSVMVAAGLLARNAVERGLETKPWVKTSLAPGSRVVTEYLDRAGLTEPLDALRFNLVGYGCTTCIGNSGPLPDALAAAVSEHDLAVVSVLSGNRNFEGRIHPQVRASYLASPPLVVAYALAGSISIDVATEPLGTGSDGQPVYLRDLWPTPEEVRDVIASSIDAGMYETEYARVWEGDERWREMAAPTGALFAWDDDSTYVREPPYFEGLQPEPEPPADVIDARVLAVLGDSVTTDHISPAGSIPPTTPAGKYLIEHGVEPREFNSYGSRRGNHEVMIRGTFANIRLRNQLVPDVEGGVTVHLPDGEQLPISDAADRYAAEGVPLVVLAGREYGSGSSRELGGEGHAAARGARRDRAVVRADPPLEPGRNGRATAAIRSRRHAGEPRPDGARAGSRSAAWPTSPRAGGWSVRRPRTTAPRPRSRPGQDRRAGRGRLPAPRRDPADGAAADDLPAELSQIEAPSARRGSRRAALPYAAPGARRQLDGSPGTRREHRHERRERLRRRRRRRRGAAVGVAVAALVIASATISRPFAGDGHGASTSKTAAAAAAAPARHGELHRTSRHQRVATVTRPRPSAGRPTDGGERPGTDGVHHSEGRIVAAPALADLPINEDGSRTASNRQSRWRRTRPAHYGDASAKLDPRLIVLHYTASDSYRRRGGRCGEHAGRRPSRRRAGAARHLRPRHRRPAGHDPPAGPPDAAVPAHDRREPVGDRDRRWCSPTPAGLRSGRPTRPSTDRPRSTPCSASCVR